MSATTKIQNALRRTSSQIALWAAMAVGVPVAAQSAPAAEMDTATYAIKHLPVEQMPDMVKKWMQPLQLNQATPIAQDDPLLVAFSKTKLGRDLLDWAKKAEIQMFYDSNLPGAYGIYDSKTHQLRIQPNMLLDDSLATLAHELWHAFQDDRIHYGTAYISFLEPQQRWTLLRFCEADAHAFSAYFMADYIKNAPKNTLEINNSVDVIKISALLLQEMDSDDGLTLREYREIAFEYFLKYIAEMSGYLEKPLEANKAAGEQMLTQIQEAQDYIVSKEFDKADEVLKKAEKNIAEAPSKKRFEKMLRKFGAIEASRHARSSLKDASLSSQKVTQDYAFMVFSAQQPETQKSIAMLKTLFKKTAEKYDTIKDDLKTTRKELKTARKNYHTKQRDNAR